MEVPRIQNGSFVVDTRSTKKSLNMEKIRALMGLKNTQTARQISYRRERSRRTSEEDDRRLAPSVINTMKQMVITDTEVFSLRDRLDPS